MMETLEAAIELAVATGEMETGYSPAWVAARSEVGRGVVRASGASRGKARAGRAPEWTEDEERFLRERMGEMTDAEIGARLGRSEIAVHLRWSRNLRLPARSKSPDLLTAEKIADGLGIDSKTVHALIDRGILEGWRLPGDDVTRVVARTTLLRFIVNPRAWAYIDPGRIGVRWSRRVRDRDVEFWARARGLALRARERWDDEWWTVGQAARYHGVDQRLVNRDIHQGKLAGIQWGNWKILRSDAIRMRYGHGKGSGHEREWSERADAFLILATAVGFSTNAISAMMGEGWRTGIVSYRLKRLRETGQVGRIIREHGLKVVYRPHSGKLFADWREYRGRFPGLARAMSKMHPRKSTRAGEAGGRSQVAGRKRQPRKGTRAGESGRMSRVERLHARGVLLKWAEWKGVKAELRGPVSEGRLRMFFSEIVKGRRG
jgi:hypothetical protein